MTKAITAPPATLVIFGALGDLTRRLLVPAIVNLAQAGLLDPATQILGVSHHEGDDDMLRGEIDDFLTDAPAWNELRPRVQYLRGDFEDQATFEALAERLAGNVVFYFATAPSFFGPLVHALGEAGLLGEQDGFRRVVIEKPFGTDLASARALNKQILGRADESQIYRIDHFLGKETVQNIMVARFGNTMIEAVMNNRYVDSVQITAAETVTVGSRGKFYDATGALRDMVPNHLFQLLAMIAMEPPVAFDADAIRTEKGKVIAAIRPIDPADAVRGRYTAGSVADKPITAYVEEADVDPAGRTETYAALAVKVETWRWSGVPFYLRTGKALSARDTEIVVQFREVPLSLFRDTAVDQLAPNQLIFQIQPNEGMSLDILAKRPGPVVNIAPVSMNFAYKDRFDVGGQTGYETLLYDVLIGDQTLFQRADHIEAGWRAVQPVLDAWQQGSPEDYPAGSAGPQAADALLQRAHETWHPLG